MTKHIMLMFLSDIKTDINDNGSLKISEVNYTNLTDGFGPTYSTNESAIRYLLQKKWNNQRVENIDKLFVFVSSKVKNEFILKKVSNKDQADSEKTTTLFYQDANQNKWTHWEYFKYSLGKRVNRYVLPGLQYGQEEDIFEEYPYGEQTDTASNMAMVVGMAGQIQEYVANNADEVILHVDLSGGKRHVSIMMLELMRLMEYNNVKIGYVLYSDFRSKTSSIVVEVTNIYQFFNLISGAEEFVQFGSVVTLQAYYQAHPEVRRSTELRQLLTAMECFADEVKLCHRQKFVDAIDQLDRSIRQFEQSNIDLLGDQLMRQMVWRIKEEYKELLQDESREFRAIRWCVNHDYLQQALTLYNEIIPKYLFDKNVIALSDKGRKYVEKKCKKDNREIEFYVLNEYNIGDKGELDRYNDELHKRIKDSLQYIIENGYTYDRAVDEINLFFDVDDHLKYQNYEDLKVGFQFIYNLKYHPDKAIQFDSIWYKKIVSEYCQDRLAPSEEELASLSVEKIAKKLRTYIAKNMSPASIAKLFGYVTFDYARRSCKLRDDGALYIRIPDNQYIQLINRYGRLKDERNLSNHAKLDESYFTVPALKAYIEEGLKELEAL